MRSASAVGLVDSPASCTFLGPWMLGDTCPHSGQVPVPAVPATGLQELPLLLCHCAENRSPKQSAGSFRKIELGNFKTKTF